MSLKRRDIINRIYARTERNKKEVGLIFDTAIEVIMEAVINGHKVVIPGFGTFEPRLRDGRMMRSPHQDKMFFSPARRFPHFKPSVLFTGKVCDNLTPESRRTLDEIA